VLFGRLVPVFNMNVLRHLEIRISNRALDGMMIDELEKNLEGNGDGLIQILSLHLPRMSVENREKSHSYDSSCPGGESNRTLAEHKSRAVPLDQPSPSSHFLS
jgi:hypothetical protein